MLLIILLIRELALNITIMMQNNQVEYKKKYLIDWREIFIESKLMKYITKLSK